MAELSGDDKKFYYSTARAQVTEERDNEQNEFSWSMGKSLHLSGHQVSQM